MDNIDELTIKLMQLREVDPHEFKIIIENMVNTIQKNQREQYISKVTEIIQSYSDDLKKIQL